VVRLDGTVAEGDLAELSPEMTAEAELRAAALGR
jgi:hypothetical protein